MDQKRIKEAEKFIRNILERHGRSIEAGELRTAALKLLQTTPLSREDQAVLRAALRSSVRTVAKGRRKLSTSRERL